MNASLYEGRQILMSPCSFSAKVRMAVRITRDLSRKVKFNQLGMAIRPEEHVQKFRWMRQSLDREGLPVVKSNKEKGVYLISLL